MINKPNDSEERVTVEPTQKAQMDQKRPSWGVFEGAELDKEGKYKPPTEGEKMKHENNLVDVARIFEGAGFYWTLDGASNISLYEGKQVRVHKDIDLSILSKDAEALNQHLKKHGFKVFVSYEENGEKRMRPFNATEAKEKLELMVCKVNDQGVVEGDYKGVNYFDLHIHHETPSGNVRIAYNNAELPKEWFEAKSMPVGNGKAVNVSHPALVIYHKLNHGRDYDYTDSKIAARHLKSNDLERLIGLFEKEKNELSKKVDQVLDVIWKQIHTIYEYSSDPSVYAESLWSNPLIGSRRGDKNTEKMIQELAKEVAQGKPDLKKLKVQFEQVFQPFANTDKKINFLRDLKKQGLSVS
jgi:flagellar biosynthesis chaperone FliJ